MNCPPFTDLAAPAAAATLRGHLDDCSRCRALIARLEVHNEPLELAPSAPRPVPPTDSARPGSVWSFWAPGNDEYLVGAVLHAEEIQMLIVPLLLDTRWATENDIQLPVNTLGYSALAPVWASDHVLAEQAVEPLNMLSERDLATLSDGYEAIFAGRALTEPAGPAVLGAADPRIAAHAAIADGLRAYFAPWSALQGADELGPILAERREDAEIELEDWSETMDIAPAVWRRFETAQLDPYAEIPVSAIAKAIRLLGLIASRRIIDLAHASVQAHYAGQPTARAPAQARRRRGVAQRPRPNPEGAREAADRYAAALREELRL
jgi:hypothetical protein